MYVLGTEPKTTWNKKITELEGQTHNLAIYNEDF